MGEGKGKVMGRSGSKNILDVGEGSTARSIFDISNTHHGLLRLTFACSGEPTDMKLQKPPCEKVKVTIPIGSAFRMLQ